MRQVAFHEMVQIAPRHLDDVKRIKRVMFDRGFDFSLSDCEGFWEILSRTFSAGWLMLPDSDGELWTLLSQGRYPHPD